MLSYTIKCFSVTILVSVFILILLMNIDPIGIIWLVAILVSTWLFTASSLTLMYLYIGTTHSC
uniref:Uncharacterized protein n=1 Tax=Arundo donax TaxID=35708 RepID=A0A0A9DZ76_ARUDO